MKPSNVEFERKGKCEGKEGGKRGKVRGKSLDFNT